MKTTHIAIAMVLLTGLLCLGLPPPAGGECAPPERIASVTTTDGITPLIVEALEVLDDDPATILFATRNEGSYCGGGTPAAIWRLVLDPVTQAVVSVNLVQTLDEIQMTRGGLFEASTGALFTGGGWCGPKPPYVSLDAGATWRPATVGVHPPDSAFFCTEFAGHVYLGTGYEPYSGEVYRWLGAPGNDWAWAFAFASPRSIVSSLVAYHGQLFVGSRIYGYNGCETCAGSVPVFASTNGASFVPTTGIPDCQTIEEHGLIVVDDVLLALTTPCGGGPATQVWYRWDTGLAAWVYHGPKPLERTPAYYRDMVADGAALYAFGRPPAGPWGYYRSDDLGLTWTLLAAATPPLVAALAVHDGVIYAGTAGDDTHTVHIERLDCSGEGRTWHVPAEAPTIAAALDSCASGDTVLIACGTYSEHDLALKAGVTVRSETGRADCVTIDAQQQGRVCARTTAGSASTLNGLTLTGGLADLGAGVQALAGPVNLQDCVVAGNTATVAGGGVFAGAGSPLLRGCTLADNAAPQGAGLQVGDSAPLVHNSLIARNDGPSIGGHGAVVTLACCDLFGNTGGDWIGAFADQVALRGNFAADPCFCDQALTLCADSFCLPGHHPWGCDALVGALGAGCDACGCTGPVAVFLDDFAITFTSGTVAISWRTTAALGPERFTVTADHDGELWTVPIAAAGVRAFLARDTSARLREMDHVTYALSLRDAGGDPQLLRRETIALTPSAPPSLLTAVAPNPFNPTVTVSYALAQTEHLRITIHDLGGRVIAVLLDQPCPAGPGAIAWTGRDTHGAEAPSGTYVVRLETRDRVEARKVMLVR